MIIYHNSRCRKSRETLAILRENGVEPEIVEYLKIPLSKEDLRALVAKLGISAAELVRKGESLYKEQFKGKTLSEEEWLDVMVANPKLIERPIVVAGDRAVLGRPPENAKELL